MVDVRNYFGMLLGGVFLFLMILIPTTMQVPRGVLLLGLLICVAVQAFGEGLYLNRTIRDLGILCATTSLIFIIYGLVNSAPGALAVSTVYLVWPIVFLILISALRSFDQIIFLMKVLILGSLLVAISGLALVADTFLGLGLNLRSLLEGQGAIVGIHRGYIEYRLHNLSTMLFTVPFLMALVLLPSKYRPFSKKWSVVTSVALILSLLALIVSGRRAFWVVTLIAPFVIFLINSVCRIQTKSSLLLIKGLLAAVFAAGLLVPIFEIDFWAAFDNFMTGFDFESTSGAARSDQLGALINGWYSSPIFGHGHGAVTKGLIRSVDTPWAYELSYFALLFQVGVIGFSIYALSVLWLIRKCVHLVKSFKQLAAILVPLLTGLICFLIANATNPYLLKFDYLWTIFLPLAAVNVTLYKSRNSYSSRADRSIGVRPR